MGMLKRAAPLRALYVEDVFGRCERYLFQTGLTIRRAPPHLYGPVRRARGATVKPERPGLKHALFPVFNPAHDRAGAHSGR